MAVLKYRDSTTNQFKQLDLNMVIGKSDRVGMIKWYAGQTAPEGYLICDGSAISRTEYSDLFNIIGTTYGVGDRKYYI